MVSGFDEKGQALDGCWEFIPPIPVTRGFYRCDKHFHTEELSLLYSNDEKYYGYLLVEGENVLLYKSNTVEHQLVYNLSVKRMNHHNKGGQSAPRFQRKFQGELFAYIKTIANAINKCFLLDGVPTISGIIVAGPGEIKHKIIDCPELNPTLKKLILTVMTTTELDFIKVLTSSLGYLKDDDLQKERFLFEQVQELIRTDPDRLLVGEEVINGINSGMVENIYISKVKQQQLDLQNSHGCQVHIFKSCLLDGYNGLIGVRWY